MLTLCRAYVPPRSQWVTKSSAPVPFGQRALSPIQASPTEHSIPRSDPLDSYVEDADPRFAEPPSRSHGQLPASALPPSGPTSNLATYQSPTNSRTPPPQGLLPVDNNRHGLLRPPPLENDRYASYDSIPPADGQRSPAGSDASHFTSISQRGVNPNWRPPPGSNGSGPPNGRPRAPAHDDLNLNANPDFSLPIGKRGRGGARGRGQNRGGRGAMNGLPPSGLGSGGPYPSGRNGSLSGSRYPTP
jgi:hypothetical protein